MRRLAAILILGVSSIICVSACQKNGEKVSRYADAQYGFTINAPKFPTASAGSQVVPVMMFAPGRRGFASNVNVIVEQVGISRKDYRDRTLKRFGASGYALHSERNLTVSGRDAILFDFEGRMGTRALRFLELAVFDTNRFYSITCAAPRNRFSDYEAALRACLDSFELTE